MQRILWITNGLIPEMLKCFGFVAGGSGGWMTSLLDALRNIGNYQIAVAAPSKLVSKLEKREIDGVLHYAIPHCGGNTYYNQQYEPYWKLVHDDFQPHLVHIHGTEFTHGMAWLNLYSRIPAVISIQGLLHVIAETYQDGLDKKRIKGTSSCVNKLRHNTLFDHAEEYRRRGVGELEYFYKIKHVIGRTEWDKNHVLAINDNLQYHHCDEMLREPFYVNQWEKSKCEPHSIFVSQASYPIKGFHVLLQALPIIMCTYPDTKVYVAGNNNIACKTVKQYLKQGDYMRYLASMVKEHHLLEHIHFTGVLTTKMMCEQYLRSNVFVVPSAMENSSNSLAEAQVLGVPIVASNRGGNAQMALSGRGGRIYEFGDYEALAAHIVEVFSGHMGYDTTYARMQAVERHDREKIVQQMSNIYESIIKQ